MRKRGFTLIELMIVVAIIAIASALSFVKISSRMQVSRLESFAQTLASDLDYARSAAMLKGCPIRIVFCQDANCSSSSGASINVSGGESGVVGLSGTPATHYAFLRMSQGDSNVMCFNANRVTTDGFAAWDFDRRPQPIPLGVVIRAVYLSTSGAPSAVNWSNTTSADANQSIWFDSQGRLTVPLSATISSTTVPHQVVFQASLGNCDVGSADSDCLGFIIATPQTSGQARLVRCELGVRGSGSGPSNVCF